MLFVSQMLHIALPYTHTSAEMEKNMNKTNNKIKELIFWIFAILPFIITGTFMTFLPDRIPTHYDINGNIDNYGSKHTYWIIACLMFVAIVILRLFMLYSDKKSYSSEKEQAHSLSNSNVLYYVGIGIGIFESITIFFTLYSAYIESTSGSTKAQIDIYKILTFAFGFIFILFGNLLPKTRKNRYLGIRTVWSMNNEKTWAATHKFGGVLMIISGFAMIILGIFTKGTTALIGILVTIFAMTGIVTYYSYIAYKKYGDKK